MNGTKICKKNIEKGEQLEITEEKNDRRKHWKKIEEIFQEISRREKMKNSKKDCRFCRTL